MPLRTIEFTHGDQRLGLVFSQNAKLRFEREAGKSAIVAGQQLAAKIGFYSDIQIFFWAMLEGWRMKTGQRIPGFSVDQVGDIIDDLGEEAAIGLVGQAIQASQPPKPEPDESENGTAEAQEPHSKNPTTAS